MIASAQQSEGHWLGALSPLNLNHLLTFATVADCLSFRLAAERIHVSQSAVSVQVRELERRLGVQLFHRTTRNVALTREGARLLEVLDRTHHELGQLVAELRGEAALQRGLVTIATLPSLAGSFMPRVAREFAELYPGIRLQLKDVVSSRALALVQNAHTDVAILSLTSEVPAVDFHALFEDELVVLARCDDPLALRGLPVELERLPALPVLLNPRDVNSRDVLEVALATRSIRLDPAQELSSSAAMAALVREGFGVAILPRLALPSLNLQDCVALPLAPRVARTVGIAIGSGRSLSPALGRLCEFLKAHAGRIAAGIPGA